MTQRFKSFIEDIAQDGDWEYANGDSMTEDAKRFLEGYDNLLMACEEMVDALEDIGWIHQDKAALGRIVISKARGK